MSLPIVWLMGSSVSDVAAAYIFRVFILSRYYSQNLLCSLIVVVIIVPLRLIMAFSTRIPALSLHVFVKELIFYRPVILKLCSEECRVSWTP
jgi:hypothetical protein